MRHPKRAITRDIRTRNPKRPARARAEIEESAWPEGVVRVRDVMTRPVVTFRQAMTVGAVMTAMRARSIHHAPVVDDKGHLAGMVSDRDLRSAVLEPALRDAFEDLDRVLRTRTVKEVMTWGAISVKPDTLLREAADLIHTNKIGAVPVVEHDRVVGMLAVGDVLKAVIQMLDEGVISRPGRWGAEA
ncbi:MAG TPA: CBS domain-containing protein [Candidatus Nitrosotalea sp.]|nr:CBS domain-containing protein [Candidatus Nitrosotalea sp.]